MRSAEAADSASIAAIYREAVLTGSASFEIDPPSDEEMAHRMRRLADGGFPCIVAEAGGEGATAILGYAYAGPYRPRPAYRFTVENSVYLAATATRRGIGTALMERLIAECDLRGYRQMVAIIGDSANHASIALHRRCGFRLTGTLEAVGWKQDRWLDSVIMQRGLGDASGAAPE